MAGKRILVLGAPLDTFYASELWRGAHEEALRHDTELIYLAGGLQKTYFDGFESESPPNESRSTLLYQLVDPAIADGVIIWGAQWLHDTDERTIEAVIERFSSVPVLSLGWTNGTVYGLFLDNYLSMKQVVRHLVEHHGHRAVAYLKAPNVHASWEWEERYRGYTDALLETGITPVERLLVSGTDLERDFVAEIEQGQSVEIWGRLGVDELVLRRGLVPGTDFTALVSRDDASAIQAICRLRELGYAVPGDVAVCGFDDIPEAASAEPPLTTVSQDFREQGRVAVRCLCSLIDGERLQRRIVLPASSAVIRESCGCPNRYIRLSERLPADRSGSREQSPMIESIRGPEDVSGFEEKLRTLIDRPEPGATAEELAELGLLYDLQMRANARRLYASASRQLRIIQIDKSVFRTYNLEAVVQSLAAELSELGLTHCSMVLFEASDAPETGRLVFSSDEPDPSVLLYHPAIFPTSRLLPDGRWPRGLSETSLYFETLCFAGERLGYLVLAPGELGESLDIRYHALPARIGGILKGSIMVRDLNEKTRALEEAYRQILVLSEYDELTGLYNRRAFEIRLEEELHRMERYHADRGTPCLMYIDLDNFKYYNDTFGHAVGDACLAVFGSLLGDCCRSTDTLARYGGDEFIVLLPETDIPGAERLACRILDVLAEDTRILSTVESLTDTAVTLTADQRLSCSIGIAYYTHGTSGGELIRRADTALYAAKHAGKGTVRVYGSERISRNASPCTTTDD
jgi:diguanylate cyclase (GGDEF)-like protein